MPCTDGCPYSVSKKIKMKGNNQHQCLHCIHLQLSNSYHPVGTNAIGTVLDSQLR